MKRTWVWLVLSGGQKAKVDRVDLSRLSRWRWHYAHGYARRNCYSAAKYSQRRQSRGWDGWVYLHHAVLRVKRAVDHRNSDGLDNRKINLRFASQTLNNANQRLRSNNTSGYKGVTRKRKRWAASVKVRGRAVYLGSFDSPEAAACAYDVAARKHFGEFARPNFSHGGVAIVRSTNHRVRAVTVLERVSDG